MLRHLMLVPSLACPAHCEYCFGPSDGGGPMARETLEAALRWSTLLSSSDSRHRQEVVFHGGEPLVAGVGFYREALPRLREAFSNRRLHLNVQSNLWLLTAELCDLFAEHGLSVGTSLDGPERITDRQRGDGYFGRTMTGIELARTRGLSVGCICTFTRQSAPCATEIVEFFASEGLDFTVHAAVPTLDALGRSGDWTLSPDAHGGLLVKILNWYLPNLSRIRISTLDALCCSVSAADGGICTFRDCLGEYLAVAPDGSIYPCQRFAGLGAFRLGRVQDMPTAAQLAQSPVWQLLREREQRVAEECGDCPHFAYCKGGCPYDALAAGNGMLESLRDPYCPAYKRIFSYITAQALEEVFSEENLQAIVAEPAGGTLLRHGRLLTLMRGDVHPHETAQRAKQVLAAVALASNEPLSTSARRLAEVGLAPSPDRAESALAVLSARLRERGRHNNLYLHITLGCNLRCSHCYAGAGPERIAGPVLAVERITSLCHEAKELGFRQAVITGGEPLTHSQRDQLIERLSDLRTEVKPLLLVMRTNLAQPLEAAWLARLGRAVDKIGVSVDGDRDSHDARRGVGSYDLTVANLRSLAEMGCEAEIILNAVMPVEEASGAKGEAVRALARELGVRRAQFRPLLPLGRAGQAAIGVVRQAHLAYADLDEAIAYGFAPSSSCGMGQNLYVEPTGDAFPCYARCGEGCLLGNVCQHGGLRQIIESPSFQMLAERTVDTNRQCSRCALRYLCGGACRAWGGRLVSDLDAPPVECGPLHERAGQLLVAAMGLLGIRKDDWVAAGLPLPEAPPRPKALQ